MSDQRSKKSINRLGATLPQVMMLRPSSYVFKSDHADKKKHIGLIAKELKEVFPEFVNHSTGSDLYHVDYASLSVVELKTIQELEKKSKKEQAELTKTIEQQKVKISNLEQEMQKMKVLIFEMKRMRKDP